MAHPGNLTTQGQYRTGVIPIQHGGWVLAEWNVCYRGNVHGFCSAMILVTSDR